MAPRREAGGCKGPTFWAEQVRVVREVAPGTGLGPAGWSPSEHTGSTQLGPRDWGLEFGLKPPEDSPGSGSLLPPELTRICPFTLPVPVNRLSPKPPELQRAGPLKAVGRMQRKE